MLHSCSEKILSPTSTISEHKQICADWQFSFCISSGTSFKQWQTERVKVNSKSLHLTWVKAQRGNRILSLLILNHGAKWEWVVNATALPFYHWEKLWYPLYRTLGCPKSRSGRGLENRKCLAPTGVRIPRLRARRRVAIPTTFSRLAPNGDPK